MRINLNVFKVGKKFSLDITYFCNLQLIFHLKNLLSKRPKKAKGVVEIFNKFHSFQVGAKVLHTYSR